MSKPHLIDTRRGFLAMAPIWPGVISVGLAYAVVSRDAGLSPLEIQFLSLMLFSGAAQFAVTSLIEDHASPLAIVGTIALLNIRHVLHGISARRWLPPTGQPPRPLLAFGLVDESYGLAEAEVNRGRASGWYLLGAGISLWAAWNLATAAGLLLDGVINFPDDAGLDFIFPLSFVALTIPLIRHRRHIAAAGASAIVTIVMAQFAGSGLSVLAATLAAVGIAIVREPSRGS